MTPVIIGMDPHKRSATIEIINGREQVLDTGRFGTDRDGYRRMPAVGHEHKERIWAVEGCHGIGRHLAQRLVADGETVIDVPAKLSARVRVLATGQGRKTDPVDAHSVALVALRAKGSRHVEVDDATAALRLLVDHRDELGHARTQTVNRLHRLLLELSPGGAKKFPSAAQARALPAPVRPRDIAGRTRRRPAADLVTELDRIAKRIKTADAEVERSEKLLVGRQGLVTTHSGPHGELPDTTTRSRTKSVDAQNDQRRIDAVKRRSGMRADRVRQVDRFRRLFVVRAQRAHLRPSPHRTTGPSALPGAPSGKQ